MTMLPRLFIAGLLTVLVGAPAFALTQEEKTETCTFGADNQKLTGAARKTFMTRCLANEDSPRTAPKAKTKPKT
jgi:hypothetical protein